MCISMSGFQSVVRRLAASSGMLLEMQIKLHLKPTEPETLGVEYSNTFQCVFWGILMHAQSRETPLYIFKT